MNSVSLLERADGMPGLVDVLPI
jgi:putative toxin-antitoxin system antitoxin component (TIGR02293 family)